MLINDLTARIGTHQADIDQAIERVIRSGWFVLGPEVAAFEAAFANYLGAGVHACVGVGVANGTDAIQLALRALGVARGDRVATVANAGMYTTTALLAMGAQPVFMDVALPDGNVGLAQVQHALAAGVKAVVVTHLYGLAARDIQGIAACCAQAGVALLEDCAQAHGAQVGDQRVGTFGDAAAFSFYPTKNLGALGDGGAVVTRHAAVAAQVRRLRQYGWAHKYQVVSAGGCNSRLDELQAAILLALLPGLDAANARRRSVAARYSAGICHPAVRVPAAGWGADYVAHLYVVRSAQRDALRAHLRTWDIAAEVHYPIPDHQQALFGDRFAPLHLPHTEQLANEVLTLPCYPEMTDAQVNTVINAVNAWST